MIPNRSTPIKNEILIDIFAKGLLTKSEMQIVFYIIRWSWGFDGAGRRQDWTKPLKRKKIADDLNMKINNLNSLLKRMINEDIIHKQDNCYQFNEHYESWKSIKLIPDENDKNSINLIPKRYKVYTKKVLNLYQNSIKLIPKTGLKVNPVKPLPMPKETLKETIKETLKEKSDVFQKTFQDFKIMRNKIKKPLTIRAEKMILNKLEKLSSDENIQVKILEQSILHCWQDVYPLKEEKIIDPTKSGYEQFMEKVLNDRR